MRYTKDIMVFFGRRSQRKNISLIFDIDSSSVGGAIVRYRDNDLPEILFSTRKNIDLRHDFDFERFFGSMLQSLEVVAVDVLSSLADSVENVVSSMGDSGRRVLGRRLHPKIRNVYCVLSLPWYRSVVEGVNLQFEKEQMVTAETVMRVIQQVGEEMKAGFVTPEGIGILEEKVLEYKLNGYKLDKPVYAQARSLGLKLYLSAVSKSTLRSIRTPIRKAVSFRKINTASFLLVFFSVLRDMYPDRNTFMTFDIRGEVSEFSIVEDDILLHSISVPRGKSSLIREIAKTLNLELFDAAAKLSLYMADKLDESMRARIEMIVENEVLLIKNFILDKLPNSYVPKLAFILTDDESSTFASRIVDSLYRSIYKNGAPEIVPMGEEYFSEYVSVSKPRYNDHFLSLASLYFRTYEAKDKK